MWKAILFVGTALAAGTGGSCTCGQSCVMNGGSLGVCQTNGECAVNIIAPNCNSAPVSSIGSVFSAAPRCPVFKCAAPNCPPLQQETPKDAQGCSQCPRCRSITAVSSAITPFNFELPLKANLPNCPVVKCSAPNCPISQQETPKTEQGCSLCPICKGGVIPSIPPVLSAGSATGSAAVLGASLDFTAAICPLLSCITPNCPLIQQEKTTGANGCAGCPRCRAITGKAGKLGKCTRELKQCPDGSMVGRVTPSCEFSPCPAPNTLSGGAASCATILCLTGTTCVNGQCIPSSGSSCAAVLCAAGQTCQNGICVIATLSGGR